MRRGGDGQGKKRLIAKNPSKNQLGLRQKEKGFWLLSPEPKVSPWPSWAKHSRGRAGNLGVHRGKKPRIISRLRCSNQRKPKEMLDCTKYLPAFTWNIFKSIPEQELLLPLLWGSVELGSGH